MVKLEAVLRFLLPGGDSQHPDCSPDTDMDHLSAPLRGLSSLEMLALSLQS